MLAGPGRGWSGSGRDVSPAQGYPPDWIDSRASREPAASQDETLDIWQGIDLYRKFLRVQNTVGSAGERVGSGRDIVPGRIFTRIDDTVAINVRFNADIDGIKRDHADSRIASAGNQ